MRLTGLLMLLGACAPVASVPEPVQEDEPTTSGDTPQPAVLRSWWLDVDGDGWGDERELAVLAARAPSGDHAPRGGDCDDDDPGIRPDAGERCDGVDEDCDGQIDEGALSPFWPDADGDGFGEAGATRQLACAPPPGMVEGATDCDDHNAAVFPGAPTRVCDGVDTDCDGLLEEILLPAPHTDLTSVLAVARPGDQVCLAEGTWVGPILLPSGVHLVGQGPDRTVLVGGADRVPVVRVEGGGSPATLTGLAVTGGTAERGAGVHLVGDALLTDVVVRDNHGEGPLAAGAGLAVESGVYAVLERVLVEGNSLTGTGVRPTEGAGVFANGAHVVMFDVEVRDNVVSSATPELAVGRGAGVALSGGHLEATDLAVLSNRIEGVQDLVGVGLFGLGATVDLVRTEVIGNTGEAAAACRGGGVSLQLGRGTWRSVVVAGNALFGANGDGAGIQLYLSDVDIANASLVGNLDGTTSPRGVALSVAGTAPRLVNVVVQSQRIWHEGGSAVSGAVLPSSVAAWDNDGGAGSLQSYLGEEGNLFAPAGFVAVGGEDAEAWDLRLRADSVLVDAGHRGLSDPDGSRSDLGAFGGPQAW